MRSILAINRAQDQQASDEATYRLATSVVSDPTVDYGQTTHYGEHSPHQQPIQSIYQTASRHPQNNSAVPYGNFDCDSDRKRKVADYDGHRAIAINEAAANSGNTRQNKRGRVEVAQSERRFEGYYGEDLYAIRSKVSDDVI